LAITTLKTFGLYYANIGPIFTILEVTFDTSGNYVGYTFYKPELGSFFSNVIV